MIPARLAPIVFGFLLSGLMSLLVSLMATVRVVGFSDVLLRLWMSSWLSSWALAFPVVLVVAPLVRRFVERITRSPVAKD